MKGSRKVLQRELSAVATASETLQERDHVGLVVGNVNRTGRRRRRLLFGSQTKADAVECEGDGRAGCG